MFPSWLLLLIEHIYVVGNDDNVLEGVSWDKFSKEAIQFYLLLTFLLFYYRIKWL